MDIPNKPCREKYFSEMTDQEKIENLKNELVRTQKQLKDLYEFAVRLINHKHLDNHIVVPLDSVSCDTRISFYFREGKFD